MLFSILSMQNVSIQIDEANQGSNNLRRTIARDYFVLVSDTAGQFGAYGLISGLSFARINHWW